MITYPCPSERFLTDAELNRIAAVGWAQYKREQEQRRKWDDENGDSWKHQDA